MQVGVESTSSLSRNRNHALAKAKKSKVSLSEGHHHGGTFYAHNDHNTTGKLTALTLQDLEKMAESTVENQQRWKSR